MSQNDDDRVGPRSWYWSNRMKVLVAAVLIVTLIVIMILVNPGPGSNGGGMPMRDKPAVRHVVPTVSHGALVKLERTVFHAAAAYRRSVTAPLSARATQPEATKG
jgi:hypothetical protein